MAAQATEEQVERVAAKLAAFKFDVQRLGGSHPIMLGIASNHKDFDVRHIELLDGVQEVVRTAQSIHLTNRSAKPKGTTVTVKGVVIGGAGVVVMAGPCSVESAEQIDRMARAMKQAGVRVLRGGAFKPRTSPYAFQGLGEEGLKWMRQAADRHGLAVISEVTDVSKIPVMAEYADILQVGARNMQHYDLLKELGKLRKPVLLKRGMAATIEEWLLSAEYLLAGGNHQVMLCERGIRTFETRTRNTLDLGSIPVVQALSHLPVLVDPSHGTGRRDAVLAMSRAAVAAGAHGLLIEVHDDPDHALSDGAQSILPDQLGQLMKECGAIAKVLGKTF